MEAQQNAPEPSPMQIAIPQVWEGLTMEHQRRLLQILVLVCEELLRPLQVAPTKAVVHE